MALNRFATDTAAEIEAVAERCRSLGVPFAVADHHARGGAGGEELARTVIRHAEKQARPFRPLYERSDPVATKIESVAKAMYGAHGVQFSKQAKRDLEEIERLGFAQLPVCVAKIPGSLSDDARRRGRPSDFDITVRGLQINAGAGFLVVLTGDLLRMPGLPPRPLAERIDLSGDRVIGLE